MKTESFNKFLGNLLEIEPNKSQVVSCFVNLESGQKFGKKEFEEEISTLSGRLAGKWLEDFEVIRQKIFSYLDNALKPSLKSVAIYARTDEIPVFEAMQFELPLETQVMVDKLPHIYPLIELKDSYHRFVIVITTETYAQILETHIEVLQI